MSDLSKPENRFETQYGELVEVYLPTEGEDGTYLLEIALPGLPFVQRQAVVQAGGVLDLGDVVVGIVADPVFANGFE